MGLYYWDCVGVWVVTGDNEPSLDRSKFPKSWTIYSGLTTSAKTYFVTVLPELGIEWGCPDGHHYAPVPLTSAQESNLVKLWCALALAGKLQGPKDKAVALGRISFFASSYDFDHTPVTANAKVFRGQASCDHWTDWRMFLNQVMPTLEMRMFFQHRRRYLFRADRRILPPSTPPLLPLGETGKMHLAFVETPD